MNKKPAAKTKHQRETSASVIKNALIRRFDRRITGRGEIEFPCVPTMLEPYLTKLSTVFSSMGKPFSDEELAQLKKALETELARGYAGSPYSRLSVRYETHRPPHPGIQYYVTAHILTLEEVYSTWGEGQTTPLFGRLPDAKVMALARELGEPKSAPVLDVGAGNGRNSIPLARLGHPTDAVEPVDKMADEIVKVAAEEKLPLEVVRASLFSTNVTLKKGHYKLAIVAEVTSHFQKLDEMRVLFQKLADALAPGGVALVSVFLTTEGYKPDDMARQAALALWSMMFTRNELNFITQELPFDRISDESMYDYEKEHQPEDAWPPTTWYEGWAQGGDVYALPIGRAPMEHRWLAYRRRGS
jgi:2-polyprenyl-3-methyl-5-hydroxy-6-metoxy-1,4-benzoquinol methylase